MLSTGAVAKAQESQEYCASQLKALSFEVRRLTGLQSRSRFTHFWQSPGLRGRLSTSVW
jgi:hypothetical protein